MGNPICHFEFMVPDPEKAKRFYGSVFNWTFDELSFSGYTLIRTGREPGGGITAKPPAMAGLNVYFQVDELKPTLGKVVESGGRVLVPMTEIPGVGWFAVFQDPSGIRVGILQRAS